MTPPNPLDELVGAALNAPLDPAREAELARLLRESSEARGTLRSYLQIEGGLIALAKAGLLNGSTTVPAPPTPQLRRSYRRLIIGLIASAAAIAALFFSLNAEVPPSPTALVLRKSARIVETDGHVEIMSANGDRRTASVGDALHAGESLRTADAGSYAVVELADRTRLELSAETSIRLAEGSSHTLRLDHGVVRRQDADTPDRPPLIVTTSSMTIRVEGDRFALSSMSPDSLRVDMEAGKAEVVRRHDQQSLTVESGSAVLVADDAHDMTLATLPRFCTEPRRILDFGGAWAIRFDSPDAAQLTAASFREIQRFPSEGPPHKTLLSTDTNNGRYAMFSADGRTLAVYRGTRSGDPILIWDVVANRRVTQIVAKVTDQRFVLSPDARWLATIDRDEKPPTAHVWDAQTGAERFALTADLRFEALAASPDSRILALGMMNNGRREPNHVRLIDAQTGTLLASLPTRAYPVTTLAFAPDGRRLAVGITGQVQIWDIESRTLLRTIRGFERVLSTLTFAPDGRRLAGGTQDGSVRVWDSETGAEFQVIHAGTTSVRVLVFSPDGRSIVTGGIKRRPLMIWDAEPIPEPKPL